MSPSLSRREAFRLGALLTAGAALTSCASSSSGNTGVSSILRYAQGASPASLDPMLDSTIPTFRVSVQVLTPLVQANRYTGAPEPGCATWTVSDDGISYTFTPVADLKFSDGTSLDAAAIYRNFERWQALAKSKDLGPRAIALQPLFGWGFGAPSERATMERDDQALQLRISATASPSASSSASTSASASSAGPSSSASASASAARPDPILPEDTAYIFEPLVSSVKLEGSSVRVRLARRSQAFIRMLSSAPFGIVAPSVIADNGTLNAAPVGSGPYVISDADLNNVKLRASGLGSEKPPVQEVHFKTLASSDKRFYALTAGDVDAADTIRDSDLGPLLRDGFFSPSRDPFSLVFIGFNMEHPLMQRIAIRRAVASAMDRRSFKELYPNDTNEVVLPTAPAFQLLPKDNYFYTFDTNHNVQGAKELLLAAGYRKEPLQVCYPVHMSLPWLPQPEAFAAKLIQLLSEVGFVITPVPLEWDKYWEQIHSPGAEHALYVGGFGVQYRDPYSFVAPFLASAVRYKGAQSAVRAQVQASGKGAEASTVDSSGSVSLASPAASASASAAPPAAPAPSATSTAEATPSEVQESPSASASSSASASASPSPALTPAEIKIYQPLAQIMAALAAADSAESVEEHRAAYRDILPELMTYLPGVPLLNPVSNLVHSNKFTIETDQSGVESFTTARTL